MDNASLMLPAYPQILDMLLVMLAWIAAGLPRRSLFVASFQVLTLSHIFHQHALCSEMLSSIKKEVR